MRNNCIVITGQTATGKTARALQKAKEYDGEIINFDAQQVYCGLQILSGKDLPYNVHFTVVSKKPYTIGYYLIDGIKLWLYDLVEIGHKFSSNTYYHTVRDLLTRFIDEKKTIVFVGGTYLYLKQILYGSDGSAGPDTQVRKELEDKSIHKLQEILRTLDTRLFESLNNSEKHNPHRLIRKIEIQKSKHHNQPLPPLIKPQEYIGLHHVSESKLTERIKQRVLKRLNEKVIEEVAEVLQAHKATDPGCNAIGFSQIRALIQNEISKEEAIEEWTLKEVQYAHRQYMFMKQDSRITWLEV